MDLRRAVIFGGSGFLGRRVADRFGRAGIEVRVASRHPQRAAAPEGPGPGPAESVYADVRDAASLAQAMQGVDAAANAVGLYVERGAETFEAVHVQGAQNVAEAAARAGIGALIHISGIGADPASESDYIRARGRGEALVRKAFPAATVLRPSVMFGPGDSFLNTLAGLARRLPVLPLFGAGETRLQPVFVDDVAEAALTAAGTTEAHGKAFELGGPNIYTYRQVVELVMARVGRRPVLLPVPFPVWEVQARVLGVLPNPPLTTNQVALMRLDNVVSPGASGFAELGLTPRAVEAVIGTYIRP